VLNLGIVVVCHRLCDW